MIDLRKFMVNHGGPDAIKWDKVACPSPVRPLCVSLKTVLLCLVHRAFRTALSVACLVSDHSGGRRYLALQCQHPSRVHYLLSSCLSKSLGTCCFCGKVIRPHLRARRPLLILLFCGWEIEQRCQFIHGLFRSLGNLLVGSPYLSLASQKSTLLGSCTLVGSSVGTVCLPGPAEVVGCQSPDPPRLFWAALKLCKMHFKASLFQYPFCQALYLVASSASVQVVS